MTPEDYAEQSRQAAASIGHLTEQGMRRAQTILREAQKELLLKLAQGPTEYGEWYYNELLKDVQRVFTEVSKDLETMLNQSLDSAADVVNQYLDQPARDAGLILDLPRASRQTVEFLTGFSPGELIGGLTQDGKQMIQRELQQGLLGVKSPQEVQKTIAQNLQDKGPFSSIRSRAEVIWRTEANRVFSTLAKERYDRVTKAFPNRFAKEWLHSGSRHPRKAHQAMDGVQIGYDQKFIVNGYECDGPHDSSLPASETINCGCTVILIENEWGL